MDSITRLIFEMLGYLGYNPEMNTDKGYYDIFFTSFGFEAFPESHKNIIRTTAMNRLMEFYYEGCNTQHILIRLE